MILNFTMKDFSKILEEEKIKANSRKSDCCMICGRRPTLDTQKQKDEFKRTDLCEKCQAESYMEIP